MTTFLILFPDKTDDIANHVPNKEEASKFAKEILMTLDRIDCESETEISFEKTNFENFLTVIESLESLHKFRIGSYSLETVLRKIITNNSIRFIRNVTSLFDYKIKMNSFFEIDNIFYSKNQNRKLNRLDFRHCENHPDYNPAKKSPLIGGIGGFENAEKLLPSAVGDAKTKRTILINQDRINNSFFLRYENENFENQYHAFHIVKRENTRYIEDKEMLLKIKSNRKGIPRAFKIIEYRCKNTL